MKLYISFSSRGKDYVTMKPMKNWKDVAEAIASWLDYFSSGEEVFTVVY